MIKPKIRELVTDDKIIGDWERPLIEFVYDFVANDFTGHDLYHCLRVKKLALRIAENESLDKDIMVATAYLHDIGREQERQGDGDHVEIGMVRAKEILPNIGFPSSKIERVMHCIEYHEEYEWVKNRENIKQEFNQEILGFQDADRLDAIGAIGIARMFAFGGAYKRPIWIPEIAPSSWQHGKLGSSTYNHLHEKLLKLKDTMNTPTGKKIAAKRHFFMEKFAKQFENEWFGEI